MGNKTNSPLSPRKQKSSSKPSSPEKQKSTSKPSSPRKPKKGKENEKIIDEENEKKIRDEEDNDWKKWIPRFNLGKDQGLFDKKSQKNVTIKSMDVKVDIIDICVQVEFTQVYVNNTTNPIETMYTLVLPLKTAISQFSVVVDGKTIKGIVKTKEEAANDYEDAIASGHGGYHVRKTEKKDINEFKIDVGNIPPGQSSEVHIAFIYTAFNRNGNYVFNLPAELLPAGVPIKGVCNIKMSDDVSHVYASQGKVAEDFSTVTWGENDNGNQEVTIIVHLEKQEIPRAVLEVDPESKSVALMVTNTPVWNNFNPDLIESQVEVIFIVDRSGSMSGARISQTKEAMNLLIHSLPPNSKFNVIGFGTSQDWLFKTSVPYGEKNLETAYNRIQRMTANLGGTDLLSPLQRVFKQKADIEYPRIILVITDGEVSDREGAINEVKRHSAECRVYCLGISSEVDKELVNGIAQVGGGESAFVENNIDIEERVMGLFSKAFQPCTRNIVVKWPGENVLTAPKNIPPIFKGDRMVAFALLQDSIDVDKLSITAVDPMGQHLNWDVPVIHQTGNLVNKLAAYSVIRSLQEDTSEFKLPEEVDSNKVKEIITKLGVRYQLATKYTSFIAVDERDNEAATGSLTTVIDKLSVSTNSHSDSRTGKHSGTGSGSDGSADVSGSVDLSGSAGESECDEDECNEDEYSGSEDKSKVVKRKKNAIPTQQSSMMMVTKIEVEEEEVKEKRDKKEEKKKKEKTKQKIEKKEEKYEEKKGDKKVEKKENKKEKEEKKEEKKQDKKDTKAAPSGSIKGKTESELKSLIVSKQKFDGSWDLKDIISILGISQNKVESANPSVSPGVWATALGIAFLEVLVSKSKPTWQMVAKKARAFIAKALINEGKSSANDVTNKTQTIVDEAVSLITQFLN